MLCFRLLHLFLHVLAAENTSLILLTNAVPRSSSLTSVMPCTAIDRSNDELT